MHIYFLFFQHKIRLLPGNMDKYSKHLLKHRLYLASEIRRQDPEEILGSIMRNDRIELKQNFNLIAILNEDAVDQIFDIFVNMKPMAHTFITILSDRYMNECANILKEAVELDSGSIGHTGID